MNSSNADLLVSLRPGLSLEIVPDGANVLTSSGRVLAQLNQTGAVIVELARSGLELGAIVELLASAYEKSPEALGSDVENVVTELCDQGVLEIAPESRPDTTVVTGIWDLGRGSNPGIPEDQRRGFDTYLERLTRLLTVPAPMVIYVDSAYEDLIWEHRSRLDTEVIHGSVEQLREGFPFLAELEGIRNDPEWLGQADWLETSPQAVLPDYAPLVLSKLALLHEQALMNPFETDHLVWVDGALSSTVPIGMISDAEFWTNVAHLLNRFLLATFPYRDGAEIHGFPRGPLESAARVPAVDWVARGGFFGGDPHHVITVNALYQELLRSTLASGHLGTEESLLTILAHRHPELFNIVPIGADGLLQPFFEQVSKKTMRVAPLPSTDETGTALYVLSFNQPQQFQRTLESWSQQAGFVADTRNYLVDNSTDHRASAEYRELCRKWGFEYLKVDNLGINGGRQFCADHFESTDSEHMIYLEDDMQLKGPDTGLCKVGLPGYVPDLFARVHAIMDEEDFDFLKFSFSEVWGHNGQQWSWYNVPQSVREATWPDFPKLPEEGLADEMPQTRLGRIGTIDGLSYITGEIYYANWPQIVSRRGNRRMFLDTRWSQPFEQTWMAHMFELTTAGQLRPAVLLASPVCHERVHHYEPGLRKES